MASEATYPDCANTWHKHKCHPYYAKRYDGYCLDCANAGIPEAIERARDEERERCAKIAEGLDESGDHCPGIGAALAAEIREGKS